MFNINWVFLHSYTLEFELPFDDEQIVGISLFKTKYYVLKVICKKCVYT